MMVQGDVLNLMGLEDEALQAYVKAADHAKLYLEPLKKIVEFFKEKNNFDSQLKYLEKLDRLSPLNVERKIAIGEIHLVQGRAGTGGRIFSRSHQGFHDAGQGHGGHHQAGRS